MKLLLHTIHSEMESLLIVLARGTSRGRSDHSFIFKLAQEEIMLLINHQRLQIFAMHLQPRLQCISVQC